MTRILILGAGGMLGHQCVKTLSDHGEVVAVVRRRKSDFTPTQAAAFAGARLVDGLDLSDHAALRKLCAELRPDVLINAAGIIKQRNEAKEAVASIQINALLPHVLAQIGEELGAYLMTFSTDCVFSCAGSGPYRESDSPSPDDLYGRSKWMGEVSHANALTLRMSIIGHELFEPKTSLLEWALSRRGTAIDGYRRALYTGLTTLELSKLLAALMARKDRLSGIWHVAGPATDKYALLSEINSVYHLGLSISPKDHFVCDRRLDGSRFAAATGYQAPSWRAMLEELAASV
jgi:dTDP-4-dehydrorhamnose reductase